MTRMDRSVEREENREKTTKRETRPASLTLWGTFCHFSRWYRRIHLASILRGSKIVNVNLPRQKSLDTNLIFASPQARHKLQTSISKMLDLPIAVALHIDIVLRPPCIGHLLVLVRIAVNLASLLLTFRMLLVAFLPSSFASLAACKRSRHLNIYI